MKTKLPLFFLLLFSWIAFSQNKVTDSLIVALQKTKNDIDRTQILNAIANEYKTFDPKLMTSFALKALQLAQKINYKIEEGNAYLNLGNAAIISGNYSLALQNFSKAQFIFENETDSEAKHVLAIKKGLAKAYGSMGIVFSEQSNFAKALQFHLKAVRIYESINDVEKCARIYNNIGIV